MMSFKVGQLLRRLACSRERTRTRSVLLALSLAACVVRGGQPAVVAIPPEAVPPRAAPDAVTDPPEFAPGGLSVRLVRGTDGLRIEEAIAGGPGERAGLRDNDVVVKVDGTLVVGLSLDDAVRLMRGPVGSQVTLTVQREGELREFSAVREVVDPFRVPTTQERHEAFLRANKAFSGGDGSSPATAIVIKPDDPGMGIFMESIYRRAVYPDYVKGFQALVEVDGKKYDAISLRSSVDGAELTLYFDISHFFGKH